MSVELVQVPNRTETEIKPPIKRAFIPGNHPWNTGGKKGRSGPKPKRAPVDLVDALAQSFADPQVINEINEVLKDRNHKQYAAVLTTALDRRYGRPHQTVSAKVDNTLEIVLRHAVEERTG